MEEKKNNISIQFNLSDYISTDRMKEIAEKVFEESIKEFIDQIIKNRTYDVESSKFDKKVGIVDQMLLMGIQKYVDANVDQELFNDFRTKINIILNGYKDGKDNDCHKELIDDLNKHIEYQLERVVDKYMKDNIHELTPIISARILDNISKITDNKFGEILANNIKFDDIIKSSIETFIKDK